MRRLGQSFFRSSSRWLEMYVGNIYASGTTTLSTFSTAGIIHNNSSGVLSSSLIVNADVSASAAIADTKLATISTAGKVSNSATTATSANTASAIVARDSNGNFVAGTITSALILNDGDLTFRSSGDVNHLLKYVSAVDGPELRGNGGGILTTNSGGNATKLSWNTTGVSVTGTFSASGASTVGTLRVGSSGTVQKQCLCVKQNIGSSVGATGTVQFTISFGITFANVPLVTGTIVNEAGTSYVDTFAWTVRSVSTTGFVLNVYRIDGYGAAWGQSINFHYTAIDIT